ncbi:ATP-dependent nuclease [Vibrio fluvialis]|uniref:ATP-dependent nuclease n=1 Tax=Vibrio fluvialis TaxID=676 RepID=UPI0013021672|nr:AAA family ATPase [Vibrio fluvialis]
MYLKSLEIVNFRKFKTVGNNITFVAPTKKTDDESMISSSTTLIVGKNNSGKTTVTKALAMAVSDQEKICGHDFNYSYINELFEEYTKGRFNIFPSISFKLIFGTDPNVASLVNSGRAISLNQASNKDESIEKEFTLNVLYEMKNKLAFKDSFEEMQKKISSKDKRFIFKNFIDLISSTKFEKKILSQSGEQKIIDISSLIELKVISAANNIHDNKLLSKAFNKIIKYKYENTSDDFDSINELIDSNNDNITDNIRNTHESVIQKVLQGIIGTDTLGIELRSDLTFDKLMNGLITYEHKDSDYLVPEGQFGLGYANLISIISEIIDYIARSPNTETPNKVRLICIEEPETFMHPQMQVNFIRHIDSAVRKIIGEKNEINSQILITTHSAHILNSKIHSSGSLDNINYIYPHKDFCENISIKDSDICESKNKKDEFYFIKKHIKHQIPELFFADGVIFVEGITEERILNFYIERDKVLSTKHISVFRVDGAHGKVYDKLMRKLKIPSLIITDIDFKRNKDELKETYQTTSGKDITCDIYPQMTVISSDRRSTNSTLLHFFKTSEIHKYTNYYQNENIMVVFQKDSVQIDSKSKKPEIYYASSLEEALVLTNYNNAIFRRVLESTIPIFYSEIIQPNTSNFKALAENSFRIQKELTNEKSKFANNIIFNLVVNEKSSKLPALPEYINAGLTWLSNEMSNKKKGEK